MGVAIDVHDDALSRESLRTMAGDSVAVVEVPHLVGVKVDGFAIVHAHGKFPVFLNPLNGAEVSVGNSKLAVRSSEAEPIAD